MNDNRKLVIRKAKDGINHDAVLLDYCGGEYEKRIGTGYTKSDALNDLMNGIRCEIYCANRDLDFIEMEVIFNGSILQN